jgi:hypothetical protein
MENGRQPQFISKCKTTLMFFKMEDNFICFPKWKMTKNNEDDPNSFKMEDDLNSFQNGRRPHFFSKWKISTFFFVNGRRPQFSQMKDDL